MSLTLFLSPFHLSRIGPDGILLLQEVLLSCGYPEHGELGERGPKADG